MGAQRDVDICLVCHYRVLMSETLRILAIAVSIVAPGLPLLFSNHPGRGLAYFFGFYVALFLFFPLAIFIVACAIGDLEELE